MANFPAGGSNREEVNVMSGDNEVCGISPGHTVRMTGVDEHGHVTQRCSCGSEWAEKH